MRQYVRFLAVIIVLSGILLSGCYSHHSPEATKDLIRITALGGNQFKIAIKKSAFPNSVGDPRMGGSFTGGELNLSLSEVKDGDNEDVIWLESSSIYMTGHRRIQFAYVNGDDIFLPVVSSDPEINCGYDSRNECWNIDFSQGSYENLGAGQYFEPVPIKLAGISPNAIKVAINIFYFYDPSLTLPVYVSGFKFGDWKSKWDWKDPYYPDEEGFVEIILSSERMDDGFNLSWFDDGTEIWMNLNQLKRDSVPCIEDGTSEHPGYWKLNDEWLGNLPVTLTDPNSYITPHTCTDANQSCCVDDAETGADESTNNDAEKDANCACPEYEDCNCPTCEDCPSCSDCPACPQCDTCLECEDANVPVTDPNTGLQFYGDGIWGDPEDESHFRFRRESDGKWTLFFLKSDLPENQWSEGIFLKGTFNGWKLTIPLVDSETFSGWVQTENPVSIDSGEQRLNWGCRDGEEFYYAWHSNFILSLFYLYLPSENAHSFGAIFPEDGNLLIPWD